MQFIQLTRGLFAKIDDEDLLRVNHLGRWQAIKGKDTFYAKTDFYKKSILLHRFIMGIHDEPGNYLRVDHINFDGLDCQKINLRLATVSMNLHNRQKVMTRNTSGATGVYWSAQKRKWHAEIKWEGKRTHLGFFSNFEDAVAARKKKEDELWQSLSHPS